MSEMQNRLDELVQWTQEEIDARGQTLAWLERQERAVLACKPDELEAATLGLAAEIALQTGRSARRQRIFAGFAAAWKLSASALSLSSIAERLGPSAQGLCARREDLRVATAAVIRKNRRIAALMRAHGRVLEDLVRHLVAAAGGAQGDSPRALETAAGNLVDAEA